MFILIYMFILLLVYFLKEDLRNLLFICVSVCPPISLLSNGVSDERRDRPFNVGALTTPTEQSSGLLPLSLSQTETEYFCVERLRNTSHRTESTKCDTKSFSFPPDRLWDPLSLLSNAHQGQFPRG
jgi:hypothetical protein